MRPATRRAAAAAGTAALLAAGTGAIAPAPASAADAFQCGPDNRWCIGAMVKNHRRFLEISGFELRDRYRVCVTPPKAQERCKTFTLKRNAAGAHASSVPFAKHFPHARHGRYRVRWIYDGQPLGRTLTFTA